MKKYLLILLVTLSGAIDCCSPLLWEKAYICVDPCGNSVIIVHSLNNLLFMDKSLEVTYVSFDHLKIDVAPNGCKYDISLNLLVTEEEFESTLTDAGFEIIDN